MPYYYAVILYAAFLIVPGAPALYDGIPLDRIHELAALAIIPAFFIFLPASAKKVSKIHWIAALLIVMKVAIGYFAPQEGLVATYYSGSGTEKKREISTEFFAALPEGTRIDHTLNFKQEGYPKKADPFPLWFFNDNFRFGGADADMRTAPFSAAWSGYVHIPKAGEIPLINSDGIASLDVVMPHGEAVVPISIAYTASEKPEKFLTLSWKSAPSNPIKNALYRKPYTVRDLRAYAALKILDGFLKLTALALLIFLTRERFIATPARQWFATWRPYLFISYAASIVRILTDLISNAESTYFNFLGRGNDPLTYETYARYIQFTGDWSMRMIEKGSYYFQPYYYFVAIGHYLGGEGIFAVTAMQGIALAAAAVCLAIIGKYMVGMDGRLQGGWPLALLPLIVAGTPHMKNESFLLFPSAIGALGAAATGALLLMGKRSAHPQKKLFFFCAGLALGLGAMSRFNFLIWIPWILVWMLVSFGRRSALPLIAFLVGVTIIVGSMVARNRSVSRNWEIVTRSNPTINFLGSLPPEAKTYSGNYDHPLITQRIGRIFDERATPAIEWIMDHPKKYVTLLGKKITETALWFPWQFGVFLAGSCMYLWKPRLFSSHARRTDYLLVGMFPITQVIGVIIMSNNNMRYHLPAVLYMAIWASLCAIMVLNVFRLRGAEQEKEAGDNDIPIETGGALPS